MSSSNRRGRDERGVGTVLTIGICMALLVSAWAAGVAVAWLGQVRAAQDAADLTVLAAAGAMAEGGDACVAAEEAAARNDARLDGCVVRGGGRSFVVEVSVAKSLEPHIAGAPPEAVRQAAAGAG